MKVSLVVIRLSLYTHQSLSCSSDCPCTHHRLPGGIQTIPIYITVSLVVLGYPYTHNLLSETQTIPLRITDTPVALRLSLYMYSSQSLWWYSDYLYTLYSIPCVTQTIPILITVSLVAQTIPILITVSLVVLTLSLYSSQFPWW